MSKYVITNFMKRHERSSLCFKLYNEMLESHKLYHLTKPMGKTIENRIKAQRFKTHKEPIFAITRSIYKGLTFYIFLDKEQSLQIVFNTSPIDASYVEFTRIVGSPKTDCMIYTQHALDRYNERAHGRKYDNYKDIMKRLILNNPYTNSMTAYDQHKITMRVAEGFLSGTADDAHKLVVINTFFDKNELEDNKLQHNSRTYFDSLNGLTPELQAFVKNLEGQWMRGEITHKDMVEILKLRHALLIEEARMMNLDG